jgi:hypothetical protein
MIMSMTNDRIIAAFKRNLDSYKYGCLFDNTKIPKQEISDGIGEFSTGIANNRRRENVSFSLFSHFLCSVWKP